MSDAHWRTIADIAPRDDQRRFVAALSARYLLLSSRVGIWHSLAIAADDAVVGHVMWAYDTDDGCHWIGGLIIDAGEPGRGVGRAATRAAVEYLRGLPGAREIRLSYSPDNTAAAHLYETEGFRPTGETMDDEVVAARPLKRPDRHPSSSVPH